jgi:hypothetical protein
MEYQRTAQEILAAQARVVSTRIDAGKNTKESVDVILDHFNCDSLEELAEQCNNKEVDNIESYIHEDDAHDYVLGSGGYVSTDNVGEMTSEMNNRFTEFMDNTRQIRNHFILNEENLDEIRSIFHRVLSEYGLE